MIGIAVVTHAGLATELCRAAEMILGPLSAVASVSIDRQTAVEHAREELQQTIERVGAAGNGVLILTDMFGGTPTNLSAEFLQPGEVEILCGVNLPMLIKAVRERSNQDLAQLGLFLRDYGRAAIVLPTDLL
jgi:PTS system mannose-specific IIA component